VPSDLNAETDAALHNDASPEGVSVKELGMSLLKVLNRLNQLFIFSWAN
jgi:hypothetical protein